MGVSLRTVGHWETGKARPAYAAFKLLRVLRHGEFVDPQWSGCRIVRGKLVTPEGHAIGAHEVSWLSLLVRRSKALSDLLAQRADRSEVRSGERRTEGGDARSSSRSDTNADAAPRNELFYPHGHRPPTAYPAPQGAGTQNPVAHPLAPRVGSLESLWVHTGDIVSFPAWWGGFSPLSPENNGGNRAGDPVGPSSNTGQKSAHGAQAVLP